MRGYIFILFASLLTLVSCHRTTIEDQAENAAADYTERYCPTPVNNMNRTDSVTFDRDTRTFTYYYTLFDKADNPEVIAKTKKELYKGLLDELRENTGFKVYKDSGFNFHYVLRSASKGNVLYELTFTKRNYK